jgi:putative Mn2+ efflux pump MntP
MDAFAVSIATGLSLEKVTHRHTFRMAFHFGLFQFLMPILGWCVGSYFANENSPFGNFIQCYDHWIAFALLTCIGGKMLWEAKKGEEKRSTTDPTRGIMLVTLSIATSIDAFAVGLSLACLNISIWKPSVAIGALTALLSMIGILFGGKIGSRWSHYAEIAGGIVLILIGAKILLDHLLGM